jgi:hypothetical protein
MMNKQTGERMTAQVTFGRDYSDRTSPDLITCVPTSFPRPQIENKPSNRAPRNR